MTTPTPEEPPREDNPFHAPDFATSRPEVPQNTSGGFAPGAYPGMPPLPPAPQVQRVGMVTKIWVGLGLVVALGLGSLSAFGFAAAGTFSRGPVTGSCLYLSSSSSSTQTFHKLSCDDERATYVVDAVRSAYSSCTGSDYVRFRIYDSRDRPESSLCLALNVKTGDCLTQVDDETEVHKVGCGNTQAEARVTVVEGARSESSCKESDLPLVYSGPPARVVCLLPTGENI